MIRNKTLNNLKEIAMWCLFVLVASALCACGTTVSHKKVLDVTSQAYDSSLVVAGDAYKSGLISETAKERIIDAADLFRSSWLTYEHAVYDHSSAAAIAVALADLRDVAFDLAELLSGYGVTVPDGVKACLEN